MFFLSANWYYPTIPCLGFAVNLKPYLFEPPTGICYRNHKPLAAFAIKVFCSYSCRSAYIEYNEPSICSMQWQVWLGMMTLWHANTFRIAGPLWEKTTSHWRIPFIKGQWCKALMFWLLAWACRWTDSQISGDLRRHDAHVKSSYCVCTIWSTSDKTELFSSYIDGLTQDCSNAIANALELLQSCAKP